MLKFLKLLTRTHNVQPTKTTAELVAEIHEEFMTAGEKLLSQANATVLNAKVTNNIEKADRLSSLGFKMAKGVKEAENQKAVTELSKWLSKLIMDYATRYPNQRFINDFQVQRICKKYNLVCGPVDRYTGVVPNDKLKQLEEFKFNFHDKADDLIKVVSFHSNVGDDLIKAFTKAFPNHSVPDNEKYFDNYRAHVYFYDEHSDQVTVDIRDVERISRLQKMICAPAAEMDLTGLKEFEGIFSKSQQVHCPDPVVLQPVKGGYLILAAWGPEASDEDVVNHKLN